MPQSGVLVIARQRASLRGNPLPSRHVGHYLIWKIEKQAMRTTEGEAKAGKKNLELHERRREFKAEAVALSHKSEKPERYVATDLGIT
jgi:hypothetical protein